MNEITRKVRNLFLSGEYKPGEQVDLTSLSEKVNSGPVQLRRILIHLAHEQLLEIRAHSGTYVASLSEDEIAKLWRTRVSLEDTFISALAKDISDSKSDVLAKLLNVNHLIRSSVSNVSPHAILPQSHVDKISDMDVEFHDTIAVAAGFPALQETLRIVRNRLRLAAGRVTFTAGAISQIADDHDTIIRCLEPVGGSWCGDIAGAKIAMSSHLRNASDRWNITSKIRLKAEFGADPIWSLPKTVSSNKPRREAMMIFRIMAELLIAGEMSEQDCDDRMEAASDLWIEMNTIAKECEGISAKDIATETKGRFASLDMRFHAVIAHVSGLSFLSEAILYSWRQIYDDASGALDGKRMAEVAREHKDIIRAMQYFGGNKKEDQRRIRIVEEVANHFRNAVRPRMSEGGVRDGLLRSVPNEVHFFLNWFAEQCAESSGRYWD